MLAAATDLYANRLLSDEVALGYMAGRGFSRELLERYRVGYANGASSSPICAGAGYRSAPRSASDLLPTMAVNSWPVE